MKGLTYFIPATLRLLHKIIVKRHNHQLINVTKFIIVQRLLYEKLSNKGNIDGQREIVTDTVELYEFHVHIHE